VGGFVLMDDDTTDPTLVIVDDDGYVLYDGANP
jgi:hypothetical protein